MILAPVIIERCNIENLTLTEIAENELARHIIGSQLVEFLQIYNGKVVIKGSLRLNNVELTRPRTNVTVNDYSFNAINLNEKFWMNSVDQVYNFYSPTTLMFIF